MKKLVFSIVILLTMMGGKVFAQSYLNYDHLKVRGVAHKLAENPTVDSPKMNQSFTLIPDSLVGNIIELFNNDSLGNWHIGNTLTYVEIHCTSGKQIEMAVTKEAQGRMLHIKIQNGHCFFSPEYYEKNISYLKEANKILMRFKPDFWANEYKTN